MENNLAIKISQIKKLDMGLESKTSYTLREDNNR